MVSFRRVILSILALPFVVLAVIPGAIIFLETNTLGFGPIQPQQNLIGILVTVFFLLLGAIIFIWTNGLFVKQGRGTLAPWDPPEEFIVEGPYRYVRNPMIIAVCLMLLAEAFYFRSPGIIAWTMIFISVNMAYFSLKEEKDLVKRFGQKYEDYRRNVPAWIPRLTPWKGENES
jgi:protein-S-isoprenylcysteine O-methyltransferase Ste14